MLLNHSKNNDGSVTFELTLTAEETAALEADIVAGQQNQSLSAAKRCCDCNNGEFHEIRESNDILAAIKCGVKCGGSFSMSNGPCHNNP